MKLLTLKITSEFRNLENLNLSFDPANDTYVIIGNNGTGKTNILEAISSIFSVLLNHSTDFYLVSCYVTKLTILHIG